LNNWNQVTGFKKQWASCCGLTSFFPGRGIWSGLNPCQTIGFLLRVEVGRRADALLREGLLGGGGRVGRWDGGLSCCWAGGLSKG